ncbi:MAG: FG-GAP-like repeat-containing protein, partial [Anaerolineae bacterium]
VASAWPAGGRVGGLDVGDVNGDGAPDIVITLRDAGQAGILLGRGNGSLGSVRAFGVGADPMGIALADVDGDGVLDMVTANRGSGNVSVLLGDGSGGFGGRVDYEAGLWPVDVGAADADHDGDADVFAADAHSDAVWALAGTAAPHPRVFKGDLLDPIRAGDNQRYFLTVTNLRRVPITQVVLTDTLPPGLDFVSADSGGVGQWGNPIVTWNLGTFAPGEERTIRLVAHTRSSLAGGSVFTNTVVLACAECVPTAATADTHVLAPTPTPSPTPTASPVPTRVPVSHWLRLPVLWVGK